MDDGSDSIGFFLLLQTCVCISLKPEAKSLPTEPRLVLTRSSLSLSGEEGRRRNSNIARNKKRRRGRGAQIETRGMVVELLLLSVPPPKRYFDVCLLHRSIINL